MQSLNIGTYIGIAAQVLDLPAEKIERVVKTDAAHSALAAPFAGFGEFDQYPTLAEKAAVLCSRLVRNHQHGLSST